MSANLDPTWDLFRLEKRLDTGRYLTEMTSFTEQAPKLRVRNREQPHLGETVVVYGDAYRTGDGEHLAELHRPDRAAVQLARMLNIDEDQ